MRFRGEILYTSIILGVLMLLIVVGFPNDPNAITGYMDLLSEMQLDVILNQLDVNAPGWLFWVTLMASAYTYIVAAIAAIKIGSKLYPTNEDFALELVSSSPQSARNYYLENMLTSLFTLIIIFLPSFLILAIYSLTQDAADIIGRLAVMFLLNIVVSYFLVSFISLITIFRFNQSSGPKVGYLYLIFAFLVELTGGMMEEYKDMMKISVNYYISPSGGLMTGEHNWQEMWVVLGITATFFGLAFWLIKQPDYIEKVSAVRKGRFNFFPQFSPRGNLASKYPIIFDQFRNDRSFFFIWTIVMPFLMFYVISVYKVAFADDPQVLTQMLVSFDIPMMKAFTGGYEVVPTFVGFLSFEIFGLTWLYFGVFNLIPCMNIPNRDQKRDQQDLIWSNSVTPERVIIGRTIAQVINFTLMYWITIGMLIGITAAYGLDMQFDVVGKAFLVGYFYYLGLLFLFVGITMIFPVSKGRKIALWFYIISVFIQLTAYMEPSIDAIRVISIVNYYDPAGLIFEKVEFADQMVLAFVILFGSITLYLLTLKLKFRKVDLLS